MFIIPCSLYDQVKQTTDLAEQLTIDFMLYLPFIGTDDREELITLTPKETLDYLAGAVLAIHPRNTWPGPYINSANVLVNRGEKLLPSVVQTQLQKINLASSPCASTMPKLRIRQPKFLGDVNSTQVEL
ncbi:hypothetical protein Ciccas_005400 [Cichlidogyrus casuarinus]|uniref:Uncharacterized protein n=1 Tax=Cichlidogyrus casuarinus TaxID=1844966 RepID=A0ABD2Q8R5_9PLAT